MSESLKKVIEKNGYENGYKKYIVDRPASAKRIEDSIKKYGLKEGIDKIIEENSQKYSNTKERFINLYGEEEGILKWENFIKPRVKKHFKTNKPTLEKYIEKYGEENGKFLWDNYKNSLRYTKDKCIEKYGKEEGEKKWNEYIKKISESCKKSTSSDQMKYINSVEYYVDKYGREEGEKKYSLWKKSQDHSSKEFMVKKYGIENGLKKYKEIGFKRAFHSDAYHSRISQILFEDIKKIINDNDSEFKFSTNGGELRLYDKNENKPYYYDFSYKNKIIEYNGDYWHANPKIYNGDYAFKNGVCATDIWDRDKKKVEFAKQLGYEVFVVWDNDYKKDKIDILKKCINFLNSDKK